MAFAFIDRGQETTATTGTGTISLAGAPQGMQTFAAGLGDGNSTSYLLQSGNGIDWEEGNGTVTAGAPATFSRDAVIASSNAGARISLVGTSVLSGTAPAATVLQPAPNILINAGMEIDQANEGASVALASGGASYTVDGWGAAFHSATATVSVQRVADAPPGFANSVKATVGTGAAVAAGDYLNIFQPIEANELTETAFGTAAAARLYLAFWVKSSIANYVGSGQLRNYGATRSWPFNFTVTNANTWEKKIIAIPGDVTGAWVISGNGGGAVLNISPVCGSTFQSAAGAWLSANVFGTALNTNSILATNGATFQITGAKLEMSAAPTPLVREPFERMLARCRRYYEKSYDLGVALGAVSTIGQMLFQVAAGGNSCGWNAYFKAAKRTDPTMIFYSPATGASAKLRDNVNAVDINSAGVGAGMNSFYVQAIPSAGTAINITGHWTADARL